MTELMRMLCTAIRYEVVRRGVDVGHVVERGLDQDGWRQESNTVQEFDVWSSLYQNLVARFGQDKLVGDLGCGGGHRMAGALASMKSYAKTFSLPRQVYAVDINPRNVADAKINLPEAIVTEADVCRGPLPTDLDLAVMLEVLEHCEKPSAAILQGVYSLADGGKLFVSTPNRSCYIASQQYRAGEPPNNPDHRREWAPWEFIAMIYQALSIAGRGRIANVFAPWPLSWTSRDKRHDHNLFQPLLDTYARGGIRWVAEPEVIAWGLTTVVQIEV